MRYPALLAFASLLAACGGGTGGSRASCGIASMASPNSVIAQFGVPRQTLSVPPRELPGGFILLVVSL